MSTPYQPDPNQGQGSSYQPTQFTPAPQYGQQPPAQPAQAPQYGQAAQYGQEGQQSGPPQWGQQGQTPPPQYGQTPPPQYGQAPQYGQPPQAPQYGQPPQAPPYGQPPQAPQYGQAPGYDQGAYGAVPNFATVQRTPYLSGAPASFGEAITEGLKNAFQYEGRASRSACWYYVLGFAIVDIVAGIIERAAGNAAAVRGIFGLIVLGLAIVGLSVAARRLHDIDKSAFWLFLILFPVVGWIWLWVLYCQPGTVGPNQYGDRA